MMLVWCATVLLVADPDPKRIALLDPTATEVDATSKNAFASEMAASLTSAGYEVVRENDVTSLLLLEQKRQIAGGSDSGALTRAAELLSARFVVSTQLTKLQSDLLLSAEMLDAKRSVVVNRVTRRAKSLDRLLVDLPDVVRELLADSATVVFTKQREGARVWLDDRLLGTSPLPPQPLRSFGKHRVHVESDEYAPFDSEFAAEAGRTTRVRFNLIAFDELRAAQRARRIAAISLLGTGAVIGALSSIGFVEAFSAKREYDRADLLNTSQGQLDDLARRSTAFYIGGFAAVGVATALIGIGAYLLIDDPYATALNDEHSLVLLPSFGGATLAGSF